MDDILLELILERLDRESPGEHASNLLLAACDGDDALAAALGGQPVRRPAAPVAGNTDAIEPAGAFLTSVTVWGFRGIGPAATLNLPPGPGLTVVTGRNGSGKSSFAEAIEVLLTGGLRRWDDRSAIWRDSWRNLHDADAPKIRAELVLEGAGPATAERRWPTGAALNGSEATVQVAGEPRSPLERLGWAAALNAYRPFLSHAELEAFFGKPSELYDLLISVLGLDDLAATSERLAKARTSRDAALATAKKTLVGLLETLAGSGDERALGVRAALTGRRWDLKTAVDLSTGIATHQEGGDLAWLQRAAQLTGPSEAEIIDVSRRLRDAADGLDALGGTESARAREMVSLLSAAVAHHRAHGDGDCPVCGRPGALDGSWLQQTEEAILRLGKQAAAAGAAAGAADDVRRDASSLIQPCPAVLASSPLVSVGVDVDLAARLWATWATPPKGADPAGMRALADHIDAHWMELAAAVRKVAEEATKLLSARQDEWAPMAKSVLAWCDAAADAQDAVAVVPDVKKAEGWLKAATDDIRNARLAPIADQARGIWSQLRQESNVALGAIRLSGSRTRREVDIDVRVDGSEATALGVMSQGEMNALALSVFLPRATLPDSPFRFLVLDDPVQAMDPAKVDGLARVLDEAARRRQVVVFTHDDRLPEAIRRLAIAATLLEVTRRPGSVVDVRSSLDPVSRALQDAAALCADKMLPAVVASRVVPGLCRIALEAFLVETIRKRELQSGAHHRDIDTMVDNANGLTKKAALALFGDTDRGGEVLRRLNSLGGRAGDTYQQLNKGAHQPGTIRPDAVLADTRWLIGRLREVL